MFLFVVIGSVSCKKQPVSTSVTPGDFSTFPEEMKGLIKDKKIYLTSIGQSADMEHFIYIADELKLFSYSSDATYDATDIEEGSVLFAFVGCSIKGLEESGITIDEEKARASKLAKASKEHHFTLISFHLGGAARRGTTSDKMIGIMFASSTFNIFAVSGNADAFLSTTSTDNAVPCYSLETSYSLESPLKLMLGVE